MTTNDLVTKDHSRQTRAASGVNSILGAWLVIAPWVYGYLTTDRDVAWNSIIVGVLIVILAALRCRWPHRGVGFSWVNVFLGAWMVLSSWIYGYTDDIAALWNSFFVGVAVTVLAVWSASATLLETNMGLREQFHGKQ